MHHNAPYCTIMQYNEMVEMVVLVEMVGMVEMVEMAEMAYGGLAWFGE